MPFKLQNARTNRQAPNATLAPKDLFWEMDAQTALRINYLNVEQHSALCESKLTPQAHKTQALKENLRGPSSTAIVASES